MKTAAGALNITPAHFWLRYMLLHLSSSALYLAATTAYTAHLLPIVHMQVR
jgi:hypothetical protein